ncbi:MAG: hypothetical protein BGO41_09535 [Clostridiales bacterium 38-18]|nr:MAG: hypothetical protein BGO41_09535 [Clostridiales bacterium 38-18]
MNWTDVAVAAILGSCIYFGWKKGFIVAAIEFIKWIASLFVARVFFVQFTNFFIGILGDPTEKIKTHVSKYLYESFGFSMTSPQTMTGGEVDVAVTSLKLPMDFETGIKSQLSTMVTKTTTDFVNVATQEMSKMILYGLGFILLVFLLLIAFSIFQTVANMIAKLPILKELNQGGGMVIGGVIGVISVYFIMAILGYLKTFSWVQETQSAVENSQFAVYFYKYNILQYLFNHMLIKGQF